MGLAKSRRAKISYKKEDIMNLRMFRSFSIPVAIFIGILCIRSLPAQTLQTGEIGFELSSAGELEVLAPHTTTGEYINQIDRSSILVGVDSVFNYHEDADGIDSSYTVTSPRFSDYEIATWFDNGYSFNKRPEVLVRLNVYSWEGAGYGILRYRVTNQDSVSVFARPGLEILPQIDGEYGYEEIKYDEATGITEIYIEGLRFVGFKVLTDEIASLRVLDWFAGYDSTDAMLRDYLYYDGIDTDYESGSDGTVDVLSVAEDSLAPGESREIHFAVAVGGDEATMLDNISSAEDSYGNLVDAITNSIIDPVIQTGEIGFELSSAGELEVLAPHLTTGEYLNQIDRSSLLVGVDSVFNYHEDADGIDSSYGLNNPVFSDYELVNIFDNGYSAGKQPEVLARTNVYSWEDAGYGLVRYRVTNQGTQSVHARSGLEILPQIDGEYGNEEIRYDESNGVAEIFIEGLRYVGYKALTPPLASLKVIDWFSGYDASDALLRDYLFYDQIDMEYSSGSDGTVNVLAMEPDSLSPGESQELFLAIAVGADEAGMLDRIGEAEERYNALYTTGLPPMEFPLPAQYRLSQNYPNPFNPTTTIQFSIPKSSEVRLTVYDILGAEVATLINRELEQGEHQVGFSGSELPSGMYFYRLHTGEKTLTRKMLLLK